MKKSDKKSEMEFRDELKRSIHTAIVAAFSFLIALAWKDVITSYVDKITSVSPVQGKLISAISITFVCVSGIFITSKVLKKKRQKN